MLFLSKFEKVHPWHRLYVISISLSSEASGVINALAKKLQEAGCSFCYFLTFPDVYELLGLVGWLFGWVGLG